MTDNDIDIDIDIEYLCNLTINMTKVSHFVCLDALNSAYEGAHLKNIAHCVLCVNVMMCLAVSHEGGYSLYCAHDS